MCRHIVIILSSTKCRASRKGGIQIQLYFDRLKLLGFYHDILVIAARNYALMSY
jgi:hypothetical protein